MNVHKIDPELIASKCSPRHIQSVLEDLQKKLVLAEQLASEVISLNPKVNEIGAGKKANMQHIAEMIMKEK